jgi:hypothetical protein
MSEQYDLIKVEIVNISTTRYWKHFQCSLMLVDIKSYEQECGNHNSMLLAIPTGGYTVSFLKSTIGSAKGYIQPYQKYIIDNSTFTNKTQQRSNSK